MPTNGVSVPDADKIEVPEGEEATEETWIELTNGKGDDEEEEAGDGEQ